MAGASRNVVKGLKASFVRFLEEWSTDSGWITDAMHEIAQITSKYTYYLLELVKINFSLTSSQSS